MRRILAALLCALFAGAAQAHPLAPALLELRETAPAQYEVLWRTSLSRARGVDVSPRLPADCRTSAPAAAQVTDREAFMLRWTLDCAPQGLAGRDIAIAGLAQARINVIVGIHPRQGEALQVLLDAGHDRLRVPAAGAAPSVFAGYLALGTEHLLLGLDHLLFVAGLTLLLRRPRTLILSVTAFTLGHSLTLALATLGWLRVDPALTEIGIALSILWLAVEAARGDEKPRLTLLARWPGLLTCAFGLLHGLGFAGALAEVGLPRQDLAIALLAFNLGIELGQLMVVAALLALAALWRRASTLRWRPLPAGGPLPDCSRKGMQRTAVWACRARSLVSLAPAYVMGTLAAYWCLERSSLLVR